MLRQWCFIIFLCVASAMATAQRIPELPMNPPLRQTELWEWTKLRWESDSKPMQIEREKLTKISSDRAALLRVISASSRSYPKTKDRLTLFRWGFAFYKARIRFWDPSDQAGLMYYLYHAKPPYEREFMRMLFLLHAQFGVNKYLVPLGERLCNSDPKDYAVHIGVIKVCDYKTEAGKQKSLEYARHLLVIQPQNNAGYLAVAGCYKDHWLETHSTEDMRKAIFWEEQYFSHGGTDPKEDKDLKERILPNDKKWLADHTTH